MVFKVRRDSLMASAASIRSWRISVRSEAAIAASVPDPMAIPRSAWLSAAASFTPSPTMATGTVPPACSSVTTLNLSPGSTSARTPSIPTCAATYSAAAWLSPVTMTVRSPSSCRAPTAAAALGSILSVTATRPVTVPARPTNTVLAPRLAASAAA